MSARWVAITALATMVLVTATASACTYPPTEVPSQVHGPAWLVVRENATVLLRIDGFWTHQALPREFDGGWLLHNGTAYDLDHNMTHPGPLWMEIANHTVVWRDGDAAWVIRHGAQPERVAFTGGEPTAFRFGVALWQQETTFRLQDVTDEAAGGRQFAISALPEGASYWTHTLHQVLFRLPETPPHTTRPSYPCEPYWGVPTYNWVLYDIPTGNLSAPIHQSHEPIAADPRIGMDPRFAYRSLHLEAQDVDMADSGSTSGWRSTGSEAPSVRPSVAVSMLMVMLLLTFAAIRQRLS